MALIIGIGVATLDIINTTDGFPAEDEEVRALSQNLRRGGNATNTLAVLRQLGHQCEWAGTLADDANSDIIKSELRRQKIDFHRCAIIAGGHAPTSYITLNQRNGSRTIVHYRKLPEYSFADFCRAFFEKIGNLNNSLDGAQWLHVEGRNVAETVKILELVKQQCPGLSTSIEIEKPRDGIEKLLGHGDILFFSRHFVTSMQYQDAEVFLKTWRSKCNASILVCPWGKHGAYAVDQEGILYHAGAVQITRVVDTIGAGDTFNAGFIHATLAGLSLQDRLQYANLLAGIKCGQPGFDQLTDNLPDNMALRT